MVLTETNTESVQGSFDEIRRYLDRRRVEVEALGWQVVTVHTFPVDAVWQGEVVARRRREIGPDVQRLRGKRPAVGQPPPGVGLAGT